MAPFFLEKAKKKAPSKRELDEESTDLNQKRKEVFTR